MSDPIYGKFYSPDKVLSYGRPLIFSVGARSIGKSTGWAIHLLLEYKKYGRQWVYVRRTRDETMLTAPYYFDNAVSILRTKGISIPAITYHGGVYSAGSDICGYSIPLNAQQKYKSGNYSRVWYILYDEFMIAPGSGSRYLGGQQGGYLTEVDAMSSLFQTVDRGIDKPFRNETKCVFVGNAGTLFNPFFINYGIDRYLRPDTKYLAPKGEIYVVEQTFETEATKEIKQSVGYKMSTDKTKDYAYSNNYADDRNKAFIDKLDGVRTGICVLAVDNEKYGVWHYPDEGMIFVSHDLPKNAKTLALTASDHRPDYRLILQCRLDPATEMIKLHYDMGMIRFRDSKCKAAIDFFLRYDII